MKKLSFSFSKLDKWDKTCIIKYNAFGGKEFTRILRIISFFGRETIWLSLIVFYLFVWYDRLLFSSIGTTFLLGVLIIAPMKKWLERERPFEELNEIKILERKPSSRSFPSWHAYNVVSQGLLFIVLFNSWWMSIFIIILAILVCFSRIQLGAHYPSDVIFGAIIGCFGFLLSEFLLTPFIIFGLISLENVMSIEIYYQMFNPLILNYPLNMLLVVGLFTIILMFALMDKIKALASKYKERK